jgi:hypothetical protein
MTRSAKIWDFLFGAALIGSAPLAALFVVMICFFIFRPSFDVRLFLVIASIFCSIAFGAACIWRWEHRHLRKWIIFAEIFVAALVMFLFILAVAAILRTARG